MSEQEKKSDEQGKQMGDEQKRDTGRKIAEWVTMSVSSLLLLAVAGYLVYEGLKDKSPYAAPDLQFFYDEVRQVGGQYVLPVEVRNEGDRTLQQFKGEVSGKDAQGKEIKREFTIDYFGEHTSRRLFLPFESNPRELYLKFQPIEYRLD